MRRNRFVEISTLLCRPLPSSLKMSKRKFSSPLSFSSFPSSPFSPVLLSFGLVYWDWEKKVNVDKLSTLRGVIGIHL